MKTSNKILLVALIILTIGMIAFVGYIQQFTDAEGIADSGVTIGETREVSAFTQLDVKGKIEVEITQGTTESLVVEADSSHLEHIVTQVEDGILSIGVKRKLRSQERPVVKVSFIELKQVSASAGSKVKSNGNIGDDEMSIHLSSGANVDLSLKVNKLMINASSGAYGNLQGHSDSLDLSVTSGANLNAKELIIQAGDVEAASGGAADIHVVRSLKVAASSGGSISYMGSPQIEDIDLSSGGMFHKMD